jgi:hypothetical protein
MGQDSAELKRVKWMKHCNKIIKNISNTETYKAKTWGGVFIKTYSSKERVFKTYLSLIYMNVHTESFSLE